MDQKSKKNKSSLFLQPKLCGEKFNFVSGGKKERIKMKLG
jgi:hypothetical protein